MTQQDTIVNITFCMCCSFNYYLVMNSRFLYNLYETDGLPPLRDTARSCQWLSKLSQEAGVKLHFSIGLLKTVYKRCSVVATTVKILHKSGRLPRQGMANADNNFR